jgi:hypothetical protein
MRDDFGIRDGVGVLSGREGLQLRLRANYPHLLCGRTRGLVHVDAYCFVH